jgi:hypothetical protein
MPESVYCLGCGQAFPIDADPYPLNGGMCGPCVAEGRKRPWQIIAENQRLREALRRIVDGYDREDAARNDPDTDDFMDAIRESYDAVQAARKVLADAR